MITLKLENFEAVDKQLGKLPLEVRHVAMPRALRAASSVVVKRAKELVPQPGYPGDKPGLKALRDTIGYVVKIYGQISVAVIGPQRPAGAHGHLVEGGTTPHEIRPKKKKVLAKDVASDEDIFGRLVKHPGAKATPFLKPAAQDTQQAQQQAITDSIDKAIQTATGRKAA